MSKIKTFYFVIALIVSVLLGILVAIPELIPSFEIIQVIVILILYVANILFVYIIVIRFRNFTRTKQHKENTALLTGLVSIVGVGFLFFAFIITSLGIGQGFMGGKFEKELNYPGYHVKIYLYDDSFLDPLTTIKIKHKFWPVMQDLAFLENCKPSYLTISRQDDFVEFSCGLKVVRLNLKTREVQKIYREAIE